MKGLKVAIVEDEVAQADILFDFLTRFCAERKLELHADRFLNGVDFVTEYSPRYDAVFLDIEMPHMNGMECAVKLREKDKDVSLIFVTNMVQYAVKGYEVGALGYIVKPVEYFSFSVLMGKVCDKVVMNDAKEIFIGSGDRVRRIYSRDLCYVEVLDHYLLWHIAGEAEPFRCLGRMKDVEKILEGQSFFRCSNCYLVNLRHVNGVDGNDIVVGKDTIQISRRRKKLFLLALNAYIKEGGC